MTLKLNINSWMLLYAIVSRMRNKKIWALSIRNIYDKWHITVSMYGKTHYSSKCIYFSLSPVLAYNRTGVKTLL